MYSSPFTLVDSPVCCAFGSDSIIELPRTPHPPVPKGRFRAGLLGCVHPDALSERHRYLTRVGVGEEPNQRDLPLLPLTPVDAEVPEMASPSPAQPAKATRQRRASKPRRALATPATAA